MHLIVTIPAYNEEQHIGVVIQSVPRKIKGVKQVEVLVWNDGSEDQTVNRAKKAGADYVFSNKKNLGLAKTFDKATKKAVELGADIVVNTDADHQYVQAEISQLIQPILEGKADMVNGDRQVEKLPHMPWQKKYGNILGSWTIRMLSGAKLNDASSGFRAYNKQAIQSFNLLSSHTYTHETIIQAAFKDLMIYEVPVTFNKREGGSSKLISSVWSHVKKSGATIVRTILMYKAFKYLVSLGMIMIAVGLILGARFIWFYLQQMGDGHIQSLILSSLLITSGLNTILMGVLA
ncbi:MAG: glycosyltransferase family 2 protein, partial [Patescibacteria group bacterium]|nr:glycosyltransferase family 2 protein [Patescibacteria group bacterium]